MLTRLSSISLKLESRHFLLQKQTCELLNIDINGEQASRAERNFAKQTVSGVLRVKLDIVAAFTLAKR